MGRPQKQLCTVVTGDPAKIKISIQDLTYIWGWTQKAQKCFDFYHGLYRLVGQRGQISASALHKVKKSKSLNGKMSLILVLRNGFRINILKDGLPIFKIVASRAI